MSRFFFRDADALLARARPLLLGSVVAAIGACGSDAPSTDAPTSDRGSPSDPSGEPSADSGTKPSDDAGSNEEAPPVGTFEAFGPTFNFGPSVSSVHPIAGRKGALFFVTVPLQGSVEPLLVEWTGTAFAHVLKGSSASTFAGGGADATGTLYAYFATGAGGGPGSIPYALAHRAASGSWEWDENPLVDPFAHWPKRLVVSGARAGAIGVESGSLFDVAEGAPMWPEWRLPPASPLSFAWLAFSDVAPSSPIVLGVEVGQTLHHCVRSSPVTCSPLSATGLPVDGSFVGGAYRAGVLVVSVRRNAVVEHFRSTDDGQSFAALPLPTALATARLVGSPKEPARYTAFGQSAGTGATAAYETSNAGATWAEIALPTAQTTDAIVAYDAAGDLYVYRGRKLFRRK